MPITTVSSGVSQTITSGQTSNAVTVASGGILTVLSGGVAIDTAVSGQEVLSGGTDLSGVIASTGRQTVYSGGIASGTVISGVEIVSSGGVASAISVLNGDLPAVTIQAGGRVVDATIAAGGYIAVRGLTSATYNPTFETTSFTVEQTASASDTIVQPGGGLEEAGGGVATGTVLKAGIAPSGDLPATEYVDAAATTYGTVVEAGAEQVVNGLASGTIVSSGGTQSTGDGLAINTMVVSGATIVDYGALAYTEQLGLMSTFDGTLSGAGLLIQSGPGTLVLAGSTMDFDGTTQLAGGTLALASGSLGAPATIEFLLSAQATLELEGAAAPANLIRGFQAGDVIDLAGLAYAGNEAAFVEGRTVTITEGVTAETLNITGPLAGTLLAGPDGHGGTELTTSLLLPVVSSGQVVTAMAGQTLDAQTVLSGGMVVLTADAQALDTRIAGTEILSASSDSFAVVSSGGIMIVSSGGATSGAVIRGRETVLTGGSASGSVVSKGLFAGAGGGLSVYGGTAYGTDVAFGGGLIVSSATILGKSGTSVGAVLGSAVNTTVASGGAIQIYGGGVGIGTVLLGPGETAFPGPANEYVYAGGEAIGTTVNSGTVDNVYGVALNAAVADGGLVYDGGTVSYNEAAGTAMTFAGILTGGGNLVQSGPGTLTLTGNLAGYTGNISISGGNLEVATPLLGAKSIAFQATGSGRLQIDAQTAPAATISGFAIGDVIDLRALGYDGFATPAINGTAVTVTEGGLSESLLIAGASLRSFRLSDDGSGGTNLQVACYCAATLILTDRGEVPVETLAIGDLVITLSGVAEPVRWIGRRSYAGPFLAANPGVQPIRFRAESLGEGLPHRDLLVSPEHAMFVDGLLIPARCLVNGSTIVQERGLNRVDYFHVELDSHDIILAEGAPSESFIDDDSRGAFHNAMEFAALYPDSTSPDGFCAPRVESGPLLDAIRKRLDGVDVQEVRLYQEGLLHIAVSDGASAIRLISGTGYAPGDKRCLGAAISRLAIDGSEVAMDDPRLAAGWHNCEGAWRWTDGAALVLTRGAKQIDVTVAALALAAAA